MQNTVFYLIFSEVANLPEQPCSFIRLIITVKSKKTNKQKPPKLGMYI